MEAKKSSSKQVVAILLLVIGLAAGVFGVLGLVGGGGTDPYEARKSVVMVYSYLQLTDGQSAGAMGTGFAIGKPGEPVEYIVTNGHVVEYGYMGPKVFAITSAELIKALDSERIEYTMAGGGLSWTQPWFAYVFLPIGVLALIGGIILLVTSQKGVQGAPAPAGAAAGMGSGKAPARGGRGPVEKRAVLRGVTGKYSGQSFDLLKGKVVIGRDPATCNIVFDKNTPGISGRHCQVVYDPNEDCFIITDLGSSYGTFLGNGKKLTANVAEKLSTGDTFYLCDNANRFVVSKE